MSREHSPSSEKLLCHCCSSAPEALRMSHHLADRKPECCGRPGALLENQGSHSLENGVLSEERPSKKRHRDWEPQFTFQKWKWTSGPGLAHGNLDPPAIALLVGRDPTLHPDPFDIGNISLVFAKAKVWGCQRGEGTVGVYSGVGAKDSWREGKPMLDGGCYLVLISSLWSGQWRLFLFYR